MTHEEARRILHVSAGSKADEIRRTYRDLVKVWHPDRFEGDPTLRARAEQHLREINEAFATLQRPSVEPAREPRQDFRDSRAAASSHRQAFATPWRARGVLKAAVAAVVVAFCVGLARLLSPAPPETQPDNRLSNASLASEAPGPVVPRQPVDAASGRRAAGPLSGEELIPAATRGGGVLTVNNRQARDIAVVLRDDASSLRAFYVRGGQQVQVLDVRPGDYRIAVTAGRRWVGDRFADGATFAEFERVAAFRERPVGQQIEYTRITIEVPPEFEHAAGWHPIAAFSLSP